MDLGHISRLARLIYRDSKCSHCCTYLEASAWAVQNQEGEAFQAGSSRTSVEGTAGVGIAPPAAVLG